MTAIDAFEHIGDDAWLRRAGLFVAEGRFLVQRLLELAQWRTVSVLVSQTAHDAIAPALVSLDDRQRPQVFIRPQADLDAITGIHFHQGCLALAKRPELPAELPDAATVGASRILVLERVRDPDNVGGIIRSAAAFGAAGAMMGPECADPFYRKAIRTSMGAVLTLPIASAVSWPGALEDLKAHGFALVATTPDPKAAALTEVVERFRDRPVALLVGSEGEGLSAAVRAMADEEARIPMHSAVDSLNVAMAAAIALYELTRR